MSSVAEASALPREWWEHIADRLHIWRQTHPAATRRWLRARSALAWLSLLWTLGLVAFWPILHLSGRAYLGGLWIAVSWFLLARTKTLSWSGYVRFFALCLPWSGLIGVVSTLLSRQTHSWIGVAVERGADAVGPAMAIAGIGEECLKLVPVALLVLLAPRRTARFAVVDWLLLGVASGTAFLTVEETLRRIALETGQAGWLTSLGLNLGADGLPNGWPRFGLLPLVPERVAMPSAFGLSIGPPVAWYAGHIIATGLLAALVGLAVAAWRQAKRHPNPAGRLLQLAAAATPLLMLWSMVADHAMLNANMTGSVCNQGGPISGLAADRTRIPWWLQWPWQVLGHGQGRYGIFFLAAFAALLVDAGRLIARPSALTGEPAPAWADHRATVATARLSSPTAKLLIPVAAVADRVTALAWTTARDWRDALIGFARDPGEPRRAALARGLTVLSVQRAARELAYEHTAGSVRPWRCRLTATVILTVFLGLTLLLAPHAAQGIGLYGCDWPWLAGIWHQIADWWNALPLSSKISLVIGALSLIALPYFSGGLGLYLLTAYGAADWAWQHRNALHTLRRSPRQAWTDFWNLTPTERLLETTGFALTFFPAGILGKRSVPVVRSAVRELRADSAAVRRDFSTILRYKADAYGPERWILGRKLNPFGEPALSQKVEIVDARNAVLGEIDKINLRAGAFIEDKSARGLNTINPRTGRPQQTAQRWANRQLYAKTKSRIVNILAADSTRGTEFGNEIVPKLDQITGIRKFIFHVDADTLEIRQAVFDVVRRLRAEYPDFSFEAVFGPAIKEGIRP
jgi:hypothetical protein